MRSATCSRSRSGRSSATHSRTSTRSSRRASFSSSPRGSATTCTPSAASSSRWRRSRKSRAPRASTRSRTWRTCARSSPHFPQVPDLSLVVNGEPRSLEVEGRTLLVHALRDGLGLTGTHVGCDTSQCGACTVLVDGRAVKSCTLLALQAEGADVTTIEGLAQRYTERDGQHPLQRAFVEHHGLQCGFCTPGMILTRSEERRVGKEWG